MQQFIIGAIVGIFLSKYPIWALAIILVCLGLTYDFGANLLANNPFEGEEE